MIEQIVDDGSSHDKDDLKHVSERHITRITPRTERPHFGEPEVIEEYYLDNGKEVLLTKTIHQFNAQGFIQKKIVIADTETYQEFTYDDIGRVLSSKDPLGQITTYTYNKAGLVESKRGPRPDVTLHYIYDKLGHLIEEREEQEHNLTLVTTYAYDLLGRKISETNPQGHTTHYEYDGLNRITQIRYPITYDHEGKEVRPTKSYKYEKLGMIVTETNENGHETTSDYSALGKLLHVKYADGTKRSYEYDLKGNCVKEIAPNEAITKNSYDAFNRLTKTIVNNDKKTITYNSFHPIKETGPSGETTTYEYDGAGRKIATKQEERLTTYDYDAKGRLLHEKIHLSPDTWISKRYKYDDLDRVYLEKTHDSSQRVCTYKLYGYDAENNRTSITQNIDGQTAESTISYKPHSLPQVITDADGYQTNHRYFHFFKNIHGQSVYRHDTIDARGCTDEERYDARHNLDEVLRFDPYGNIIAKKKLFHDASNNLLRIHESVIVNSQEQKQIITLFTYGPYQRLDAITEAAGTPEEKTTHYIYNKHGQKETIIYADGTKLHHTYDAKGRLKRYHSEDGTIDYTYEYDKSDRVIKVINNLTKACTIRTYNSFGEVLSEELETGLKLLYTYDKAGRLQELTLPDNSKVGYEYSPTFLESITRIKGEELYRHKITARDQAGHIQSCLLPKNAGTLTFNYDKLSRRTKTLHDKFQEEAQSFDQVGNLLELQTGNDHRSFRYDFLSQLIEEKGPTSHTYSYDSLYNRLSQDDQKYTVNCLHSVLSDSKHKFTYDARGNRTRKDSISYKYDALDRLISVGNFTYTYDAFNRRLTKSDGTKYIYALDNEIGAVNSEGKITELRLLGEGLGAEIGSAVAIELEDTLYIPLHDRQGNVTTLLDTQGQVADSYRYDAFGNEITPAHKTKNPWRFSSKRVDEETGFIYFGRRYYDPTLGKWLTQDPLGLKAGPNLYAYVVNNPMTKFDLYGLLAVEFEKMNQLSGSSGYRNDAAGYSYYDKSSHDRYEARAKTASRESLPFLAPSDHNSNTSPSGNDLWDHIKNNAPGILFDGLDAIDKLSYAVMLRPHPYAIGTGIGLKGISLLGKLTIQALKSPLSAKIIVPVIKKQVSSTKLLVKGNIPSLDKLSKAGEVLDRERLTKAGRALDKHGGRPGSVFPKATGDQASKNTLGQHQLDDILTHPESRFVRDDNRGFEIYAPDGRGAYFKADGSFRGFVEDP